MSLNRQHKSFSPCPQKIRTRIMGVLNLTPDSFSADGLLTKNSGIEGVARYARKLVSEGADIIDLGAESSRPGAKPVALKEELRRLIPVVEKLSGAISVPISIDTYKPEVARIALSAGASIVNDISGLRDARMIEVIAKSGAGVVIMHMKGRPGNMQKNPRYRFVIEEVKAFLSDALNKAEKQGINRKRIIVDPGIGFGKTLEHNLEILRRLRDFKSLGCPLMVGTSRKSFIGKILDLPVNKRLAGTLASLVVAVVNGADILRVHDVKFAVEAIGVAEAIIIP